MENGMEVITQYLRNMDFKKSVMGGCDKEDVLDKIEELTGLYKQYIDGIINESEQWAAAYEELRANVQKWQTHSESLQTQLNASMEEQMKNKQTIHMLQESLASQEKSNSEVVLKAEQEAQQILVRAKMQADAMINQRQDLNSEAVFKAEQEAQLILQRAKEQADAVINQRQELGEEINELRARVDHERQYMADFQRMKTTGMTEMRAMLNAIHRDLTVMQSNIDGMVNRIDQSQRDIARW